MEENAPDFFFDLLVSPFGVLMTYAGPLYLSGHPIKLFGLFKSLCSRHTLENPDLLRAWLFVGQHAISLLEDANSSKRSVVSPHSSCFVQFSFVRFGMHGSIL
jgi:hypothetical protein